MSYSHFEEFVKDPAASLVGPSALARSEALTLEQATLEGALLGPRRGHLARKAPLADPITRHEKVTLRRVQEYPKHKFERDPRSPFQRGGGVHRGQVHREGPRIHRPPQHVLDAPPCPPIHLHHPIHGHGHAHGHGPEVPVVYVAPECPRVGPPRVVSDPQIVRSGYADYSRNVIRHAHGIEDDARVVRRAPTGRVTGPDHVVCGPDVHIDLAGHVSGVHGHGHGHLHHRPGRTVVRHGHSTGHVEVRYPSAPRHVHHEHPPSYILDAPCQAPLPPTLDACGLPGVPLPDFCGDQFGYEYGAPCSTPLEGFMPADAFAHPEFDAFAQHPEFAHDNGFAGFGQYAGFDADAFASSSFAATPGFAEAPAGKRVVQRDSQPASGSADYLATQRASASPARESAV
eukprot:NODE_1557_length_1374_cov_42.288302_g1294_i0.p1 GENE.NODE_1557_length_1374_cov_42.288302_g1294_i0~~NODE_1557_length_1374_cov_42.288302_g1294_i0.p1  ORF type:complete len:401 (-),score=65.24 NODE_1557_length_1374_cov_42.288302_g1294_i0:46-1248(-)